MNGDDVGRLMAAWVGSVPRLEDAACRGNPGPFDLDVRAGREAVDAAVEICLDCPAMLDCGAWVDSLPADQKPAGIVAGRLFDSGAYGVAKSAMTAELKSSVPQSTPRPRGPRRPAQIAVAS